MTKYTTVSIPKDVASKLERIVGHAGYRSVSEIVLWAIRKQMFSIDQLITEIEEYERQAHNSEG